MINPKIKQQVSQAFQKNLGKGYNKEQVKQVNEVFKNVMCIIDKLSVEQEAKEKKVIDIIWNNTTLHKHGYTGKIDSCVTCLINSVMFFAIDSIRAIKI